MVEPSVRLAVVLLVLVAVAVGVSTWARLGVGKATVTAAGRALLQLSVVSLLIAGVLRSLVASALFVVLMLAVASITAGRRITRHSSSAWAAVAVAGGALPVIGLIMASGVVPWEGVGLVPIAGILIGNTMSATALGGRRALDELAARTGEYEAALALGLEPRDARLEIVRPNVAWALVPPLDQTRTVGLVTLPGAFVGVLLGGGSAAQAGAAQVLVLVGILAADTIGVAVTLELVVRGHLAPMVTTPRPAPATRPSRRR